MKPHILGVLIKQGPERGDNVELSTFTCGHCNHVGLVGKHDGGMCLCCANLLCKREGCHAYGCVPFQRKLEESLRRDRNFHHMTT